MDRRQFLGIAAAAGTATLLGCERPEPLLRVSGIAWIGYEPLFLADQLDLLPPQRIRLIESPSNTNSLMQLASGEVEAATLTLDEFILARAGGIPVDIVLVFDTSNGADVVMVRPEIEEPSDLRDCRIGVEDTAAGALMLTRTLEAGGLGRDDIELVPMSGGEQLVAYRRRRVDAVISYEPYATRLARAGARRLYDSRAFPGLITDVLAVRREAVGRMPRALHTLVDAYFEALARLRSNPGRAHVLMAPRLELTVDELTRAFEGVHLLDIRDNHRWLGGDQRLLRSTARTVTTIMQENRLIDAPPDLERLGTPRFLPEAP
ncbi:MAG: ABC transporter substrate-binding protein [Pseudomonadota bacterium]